MRHFLWISLGLLIISGSVQAQKNIVFGKIGNQVIDQDFITAIQLLNPEFAFNPDKAVFSQQLLKDYILNKAHADEARLKKLNEDSVVKKNIELIKQLVTDKYLALLIAKQGFDPGYTVSDAEARSYYNAHLPLFVTPGQYSYLTAEIADTISYPAEDIKKKMKQYASMITDEFKTGDNEKYTIIFTKSRSVSIYDAQYPLLSKLKDGDFATDVDGKRKVIYLLMTKTPEVVQPFEKVKESCASTLLNEKRNKSYTEFIEKAKEKYPVSLTSDLFK